MSYCESAMLNIKNLHINAAFYFICILMNRILNLPFSLFQVDNLNQLLQDFNLLLTLIAYLSELSAYVHTFSVHSF